MPEFKLPTIRLRGFREMTSDDITQALSDVPRPKLADIADAAVAATQAAAKAAQEAAAAAQAAAASAAERAQIPQIPQRQRSRRPLFVLGIVVASLGIVALANADKIRGRAAEMRQRARERMEADEVSDSIESLATDEEAWTGSVGIPVQGDAYADTLPSAVPEHVGYESSPIQEDPAEVYRG